MTGNKGARLPVAATAAKAGTARHAAAHTAPKGRATPKRGEKQVIAAQRRSRIHRRELFIMVIAVVLLLAVAVLAGGGGDPGPTHGAPIPLHG